MLNSNIGILKTDSACSYMKIVTVSAIFVNFYHRKDEVYP